MSVKIESKNLARKIAQINKKMPKVADKIIDQTMVFFAQSAIKNTPPGRSAIGLWNKPGGNVRLMDLGDGKTREIQKKTIKKRPIEEGIWVKDRAGNWKRLGVGSPGTGHLKTGYSVPYRTSRKKGRKFFKTKGEAKQFSKIKYRYIGKASWLVAANKAGLNVSTSKKFSGEITSKASSFVLGNRQRAILTGRASGMMKIGSRAIGNFTDRIGSWAIAKTKNRLGGWAKKEMQIALKAGG